MKLCLGRRTMWHNFPVEGCRYDLLPWSAYQADNNSIVDLYTWQTVRTLHFIGCKHNRSEQAKHLYFSCLCVHSFQTQEKFLYLLSSHGEPVAAEPEPWTKPSGIQELIQPSTIWCKWILFPGAVIDLEWPLWCSCLPTWNSRSFFNSHFKVTLVSLLLYVIYKWSVISLQIAWDVAKNCRCTSNLQRAIV